MSKQLRFYTKTRACLCSFACMLASASVIAAPEIYYNGVYDGAGTTTDTSEVAQWLNTDVAKTFDGDGNNWYGTSGFLHTKVSGSWDGQASWANNAGNWGYIGTSTQGQGNYQINNSWDFSQETLQMTGAGIAFGNGNDNNYATIYAKKDFSHIRVGIMNDLDVTVDKKNLDNTTLKLQILESNNKIVSEIELDLTKILPNTNSDKVADMYFFDVIGIKKDQRVQVVGNKYAGTFTIDEVTYAGNLQKSFNATFTDTNSTNYLSPTEATKTLMRRDNGVFSTVGVETLAKDGAVNAVTFSKLEKDTPYFVSFTGADGTKTTQGLVVDSSLIAKVVNLKNMDSVNQMTLTEYTGGISTGNGEIFVDFQGVNPTNFSYQTSSQPQTETVGGVWNAFEFQAYSATPTVNPSMSLVDSIGDMTSVVLSIDGNVTGWAGNKNSEVHPLMGDYMFTNAGGVSGSYDFVISGLDPNSMYELELFTSNINQRDTYFTVNGEERRVAHSSSDSWIVMPNELGEIIGIFASSSTGGEQDWAGMALRNYDPNAVPEPTTWAMMVLGTLGIFWYQRRRKV